MRFRSALLLFTFIATLSSVFADATSGVVGKGTTWETPWHIVDSGKPGPTVLIVGGLHGNEPAGYLAAQQIAHWPVTQGKVVVMPRINRLGLAANIRYAPDFRNDRKLRDLNRNFPTKDAPGARTPLCQEVWAFVAQQKPDWVFDLHEGFDVHRQNAKSVGSSVIAFPAQAKFAQMLIDAVNVDIDPEAHFDLLAGSGPAQGSLARACKELLGAKSFILETTFKDRPLSLRTRQHRLMVSTALQHMGVIDASCVDLLASPPASDFLRVGLFDGTGASEAAVYAVLKDRKGVQVHHIGPEDIRAEVLAQFEVLIFPGGSGSKQAKAMGAQGRAHIRSFVREGGGYVGVCAGSYLCSSHYDWSLNLMNAAVFNKTVEIPGVGRKSMWYRGGATPIEVEILKEGNVALGVSGTHTIRYQNGPILSPGLHPDAPAYTALAFFRTENGMYPPQKGSMIGTPAVVTSQFGKGRVLAISPHFEGTKGQEDALLHAVRFVAPRQR